ncbi:Glycosyl transferase, family 2 [Chitinispirillum alkaliphilum]|nr:Glycosyl transferase, family 2 [Chitinispirillum alkaliphilum]
MKLIVQIPCWNEEKTIGNMIRSIPQNIDGIEIIEILVIDDGSTDNTVHKAKEAGATKVISLPRHKGLAAAFSAGAETALQMKGDLLVNTDADMQYPSDYISALIDPILRGRADMTIGDRLSSLHKPFSPPKMLLQRIGSTVVRVLSGIQVKDAASGFRAFNKDAMKSLFIHDNFSYTMESIFLAGANRLRVENVPIKTNPQTRDSRLFKSIGQYIRRSAITILRISLMYHPLRFFIIMGMVLLFAAFLIGVRFLYFFFLGSGSGHVQSLILLAVLATMGVQSIMVGMVADVVAANRRLLEIMRIKQMENL